MPDARRWTLPIASLAVLAVFLDTTVLFVAFPDITASFPEVAPQQLSWVLNGYTIVFAALLIPFGRLADRRGDKTLFVAGAAVFTTAVGAVRHRPIAVDAHRRARAAGGRRRGAGAVITGARAALDTSTSLAR